MKMLNSTKLYITRAVSFLQKKVNCLPVLNAVKVLFTYVLIINVYVKGCYLTGSGSVCPHSYLHIYFSVVFLVRVFVIFFI
jgi:hypothetical protein